MATLIMAKEYNHNNTKHNRDVCMFYGAYPAYSWGWVGA